MRGLAKNELDRVDKLAIGTGMLEAYVFGNGNLKAGSAGVAVDYGHRVSKALSLFGRAELGYRYGSRQRLGYEAIGGIRVTF